MLILNSTTPHYVRCIKSNDNKAAFDFDNIRAIQQLRACGVLETIKISSNGFPSRWTYQDFANRYRVLLVGVQRFVKKKVESEGGPPVPLPRKLIKSGSSTASELRAVCEQIVKLVYELQVYSQFKMPFEKKDSPDSPSPYQFGKSKIFFRAGQVALLERIRTQRLKECAILIQKTVKGFIYRRIFLRKRAAAVMIQSNYRVHLAKKRVDDMRRNNAATKIQTAWRMYCARKKYQQIRRAVIGIQTRGRARMARLRFLALQKETATITIQRYWRGYRARKEFKRKIRQVCLVQSAVRRYFAKKQLKALRIEARSVQHVQQLNKGLERKIIELQQKLNDANADLKEAKLKAQNVDDQKALKQKHEVEIKNMLNQLSDRDREIDRLSAELETQGKYIAGFEKTLQEKEKLIEKLNERKKMENIINPAAINEAVAAKEKVLTEKFNLDLKTLYEELEYEKQAHQQLLRRYAALEDKMMSDERSSSSMNSDNGQDKTPGVSTVSLMMRCSELEQENAKIKHEVQEMRQMLAELSSGDQKQASETASSVLVQQCASMQQELDRTREEKSHLKTIVLGQETSISKSGDSEVIAAFKMIVKQLEREVDAEKVRSGALQSEIAALKRDNERQQQLLGMKMSSSGDTDDGDDNSDFITKMNQENMILREKCERLTDDNKRLRVDAMRQKMLEDNNDQLQNEELMNGTGKNYLGMFKYSSQKEQLMLDILITTLDPQTALKFPPHLPAHVLFMCVRYIDEVNDDVQVKSLLNNMIVSLKRVVKKAIAQQNVEVVTLWLSNIIRLMTLLKQFCGEEPYGVLEESLKNFDLSEYRQLLSDVAIWTYQGLIKHSEDRIQPLIVPAVLEFEGLASSGIYAQPKQR
jgi:myosin-5